MRYSIFILIFLIGCSNSEKFNNNTYTSIENTNKNVGILEIRDRMFINQCNDIYLNPNDYKGKMIKIEGLYDGYIDDETGESANFVYRYGPGCCGLDGIAGFEFAYSGDVKPKVQDWVEVIGVVEVINADEMRSVRLNAVSVKVKDKRGNEFVSN